MKEFEFVLFILKKLIETIKTGFLGKNHKS